MKKVYLIVLPALQILVGILASVYLIKVMLGRAITMSLVIAIPAAILGLFLGLKNIVELKKICNKKHWMATKRMT